MKLILAQHYATKIVDWLKPHCARIEISGAVRRRLPVCDPIAILCIPRAGELVKFLNHYVQQSAGKAWFNSSAGVYGHRPDAVSNERTILLHLPKCELVIYLSTPELFVMHSIQHASSGAHWNWLCGCARRVGIHVGNYIDPTLGLVLDGKPQIPATEQDFYAAIGMPFIPPEKRI